MPLVKEIKLFWTKKELQELMELPKEKVTGRMIDKRAKAEMTAEQAGDFLGLLPHEFTRIHKDIDYCWTSKEYVYSRASVEAYKKQKKRDALRG